MKSGTFRKRLLWAAFSAFSVMALSACAETSVPRQAEEVQVTASEFRYESARVTFSAGQPYRVQVKNAGATPHEWMLAPKGEKDHMKTLVSITSSELTPGATASREFILPRKGEFEFACHLPGHYEAGMSLPILAQ